VEKTLIKQLSGPTKEGDADSGVYAKDLFNACADKSM
jgi:hypothetical protein